MVKKSNDECLYLNLLKYYIFSTCCSEKSPMIGNLYISPWYALYIMKSHKIKDTGAIMKLMIQPINGIIVRTNTAINIYYSFFFYQYYCWDSFTVSSLIGALITIVFLVFVFLISHKIGEKWTGLKYREENVFCYNCK